MEYPQPYTSSATDAAAAAPTAPPHSMPVAVVGQRYYCPYPVNLAIVRKFTRIAEKVTITDLIGNVVFNLHNVPPYLGGFRIILDAAQNPVLTLRRKAYLMHFRWQAFKGYSSDPKDLIFTLKRSSIVQIKTKLDVFLASNTSEQVCDFKIKGNWLERSCVVYAGESDTIVAQMHRKHTVQSIVFGKTDFMVTVYPNVDYAFIVALFLTVDRINLESGRP